MKALVLDGQFDPRPDYQVSEMERREHIARKGSNVWRHTTLQVKEIPDPEIGPEDVLIRVRSCGVCGSDLHLYETDNEGYLIYPSWTKLPVVIGHEFAGNVAAVGEKVTDFKVGDVVSAEQLHWCGKCSSCRRGLYNHCRNMGRLGFVTNGAFAEYVGVRDKYCWSIKGLLDLYGDKDMACEAGALIEPTGIAYNGLFPRAGGFLPGAVVAVYGAGPIGLAAIALSRLAGASKIIAFEMTESRRSLAMTMGADYAYDPQALTEKGSSPYEVVLDLTSGEGADVHVEAAGFPKATLPEMEQSLAVGAKVVHLGRRAGAIPTNITIYQDTGSQSFGSLGHAGWGTFGNIIKLMASRRLDMTSMVTARYPLDRAAEAVQSLASREGGKVLVKM
jgi:threonine dehydrogenase-like Zn-dependent dehydrogenase